MIDFRYHIVSLVSVFLALAIGVVLGAGPLKDTLGDTLTRQVDALREDKAALQDAVENRDASIEARDSALEQLAEPVLAGRLAGRAVALISLHGAESDDVDAVVDLVLGAGGSLASRTTVTSAWADPASQPARAEVTRAFGNQVSPAVTVGTDPAAAVPNILARALLFRSPGAGTPDPAAVLSGMAEAGLVENDDEIVSADLVVVVAGEIPDTASAAANEATLAADRTLLRALTGAGDGIVLAGQVGTAETGQIVAEARTDDQLLAEVSTLDNVADPSGRIAVVLALEQRAAGTVGHYGVGDGAQAVVPDIEPVVPADASSTGAGESGSEDGG